MKMRLIWATVTVAGLLAGCVHMEDPHTLAPIVTIEPEVVEVVDDGILKPARPLADLLIQRLSICAQGGVFDERSEAVSPLVDLPLPVTRAVSEDPTSMSVLLAEAPATPVVDEAKLDALLRASCRPARTPGVLNRLLAELTALGTWPEEYTAFFDLLITGQRAYATAEKVYVDLRAEHNRLKAAHERTIQGLSEIEAQIELQTLNAAGAKTPGTNGQGSSGGSGTNGQGGRAPL